MELTKSIKVLKPVQPTQWTAAQSAAVTEIYAKDLIRQSQRHKERPVYHISSQAERDLQNKFYSCCLRSKIGMVEREKTWSALRKRMNNPAFVRLLSDSDLISSLFFPRWLVDLPELVTMEVAYGRAHDLSGRFTTIPQHDPMILWRDDPLCKFIRWRDDYIGGLATRTVAPVGGQDFSDVDVCSLLVNKRIGCSQLQMRRLLTMAAKRKTSGECSGALVFTVLVEHWATRRTIELLGYPNAEIYPDADVAETEVQKLCRQFGLKFYAQPDMGNIKMVGVLFEVLV